MNQTLVLKDFLEAYYQHDMFILRSFLGLLVIGIIIFTSGIRTKHSNSSYDCMASECNKCFFKFLKIVAGIIMMLIFGVLSLNNLSVLVEYDYWKMERINSNQYKEYIKAQEALEPKGK